MYTPFGKELRNIRMEHNEILKNMADRLNVSSAFLSAVEVGKKSIPENWCKTISHAYRLSEKQFNALVKAAEISALSVKINLQNSQDLQRQAAVAFARKFDSINDDTAKQILKLMQNQTNLHK